MSILEKEVLTMNDVMELLNISRRTVQNWIKDGKLKAVKIGNQIRIPRQYYQEFMDNHVINKEVKK